VPWAVEYTDQFEEWWDGLTREEQRRTEAAVEVLQERGPGLGRPWVDTLEGSRHPNMNELRPRGRAPADSVRVRPCRAVLGGDKAGQWSSWYEQVIPHADELYDEHLRELSDEGTLT
jgi:hypothetical protein